MNAVNGTTVAPAFSVKVIDHWCAQQGPVKGAEMNSQIRSFLALAMLCCIGPPFATAHPAIEHQIAAIRAVGDAGQGSGPAAAAWRALSASNPDQIPVILAGMDAASALAHNWLRAAVDAVVDRARRDGKALPSKALEAFLADDRHDGQARWLAYDLLVGQDTSMRERYLPRMIDDRNLDLRREAVARVLDDADHKLAASQKPDAGRLYQTAFDKARDRDQVDAAVKKLKELGQNPDVSGHFGFLLHWKLIGPFDNTKNAAIERPFPPENQIALTAKYPGKQGPVAWKDFRTKDDMGVVNLNEGIGNTNEAIAYAYAEFPSATDHDAEIRFGSFTTVKLWVNGKLTLERYDAYTGYRTDTYVAKVHLHKGNNTILLKLCREIPPEKRLEKWQFNLRVCDDIGTAIAPASAW
jgi:hypothetical protein